MNDAQERGADGRHSLMCTTYEVGCSVQQCGKQASQWDKNQFHRNRGSLASLRALPCNTLSVASTELKRLTITYNFLCKKCLVVGWNRQARQQKATSVIWLQERLRHAAGTSL